MKAAPDIAQELKRLGSEPYCYLTTTGRTSGESHEIEIWFTTVDGLEDAGGSLFLISGGGAGSDWVKNLAADPQARVRIGELTWSVRAELQPQNNTRRLAAAAGLADKYDGRFGPPSEWTDDAYLVELRPDDGENR